MDKNLEIKKFLKENLIYIIGYIIALAVSVSMSVIFNSSLLTIFSSIVYLTFFTLLILKFWFAPILGVVSNSLYIAVSVVSNNWGEVILNCAVALPIMIYSIFSYFKTKGKNEIEITTNKISNKEMLIFMAIDLVVCIGIFFALRALKTNYIYLAIICFYIITLSYYLQLRRDKRMFYTYLIGNVLLILLWLMPIFYEGFNGTEFVPIAASFFFSIVMNVLGAIKWRENKKTNLKDESINYSNNQIMDKENKD